MTAGPPSAEQQLDFLRNVQRILSEGSFVATYKYALLHALADLAVSRGDDSGAPLPLSTLEIAERFVELYWPQAVSFRGKGLLRQNAGKTAAILNRIEDARKTYRGSLTRLKHNDDEWRRLLKEVANTIRVMPLWKLQTVGPRVLPFLYSNEQRGDRIELLPGVACCLRAHHALLIDMIRGAWLRFVRRHNAQLLGADSDLYTFLFGRERDSALFSRCVDLLREAQGGRCLYCQKRVPAEGQVDHFIPWILYSIDLGHNLVLAHAGCNSRKSDHLASEDHLQAWLERTQKHGSSLEVAFLEANVLNDRKTSERIAAWAYAQTDASHGLVWKQKDEMVQLDGRWRTLLTDPSFVYSPEPLAGVAWAAERPA